MLASGAAPRSRLRAPTLAPGSRRRRRPRPPPQFSTDRRRATSPTPSSRTRPFPITAPIPPRGRRRQGAPVPQRRRQRPARPLVAARRRPLGGRRPTTTATCWSPPRPISTPRRPACIVVYFHGNNATLARDVVDAPADAAPARAVRPQRGAGRAADGGRRARFQRRQFLARRRLRRSSSTRPRRSSPRSIPTPRAPHSAACRS